MQQSAHRLRSYAVASLLVGALACQSQASARPEDDTADASLTGGTGGAAASGGSAGIATAGGGGSGGAAGDPNYPGCVERVEENGQSQACAECLCPNTACQDELRACREDVGDGGPGSGCQAIAACANAPETCCTDTIECAQNCEAPIAAACGPDALTWLQCSSSEVALALRDCRDSRCAEPCACSTPPDN
jgi:hypothetical protein